VNAYGCENARVFFHPALNVWVLLANSFGPAASLGGTTVANQSIIVISTSLTDWSASVARAFQRLCPLDGLLTTGVACHITGPDNSLVYDAATGIVPFTWDSDPARYPVAQAAAINNLGRRLFSGQLEPSANVIRFTNLSAGSVLTRSLSHTNLTLECALQFTAGGGGYAFVYRSDSSQQNAYLATILDSGQFYLVKVVGGSGTTIATGTGSQTIGLNGLHRIKIQVIGNVHKAILDGETQYTFTDSSSPITSGTTIGLNGSSIDADVRCLSSRISDTVSISGLTPGSSCTIRGYGALPAVQLIADASGNTSFSNTHFPLYSIDVDGIDYIPTGGIWGGDTIAFSGFPAALPASQISLTGL
jgi:hypothetical protein